MRADLLSLATIALLGAANAQQGFNDGLQARQAPGWGGWSWPPWWGRPSRRPRPPPRITPPPERSSSSTDGGSQIISSSTGGGSEIISSSTGGSQIISSSTGGSEIISSSTDGGSQLISTSTVSPESSPTASPTTSTVNNTRPQHVQSLIWSYPLPPLPSNTYTANNASFTAALGAPAEDSQPVVRKYEFTLGTSAGSPDGFERLMYTINNQFPGPTIEANQGDIIEVTVHNNLDHAQAIHWHGIRQRNSNHMDGVPGVSQCPIAPGATFVYRFTLDSEMGTYWYHSHFGNTLADGISGAFIVHAKEDPWVKSRDYDEEKIMFLSDWDDHLSEFIIDRMHNLTLGYKGQNIPTQPDAILINGIGQRDCATAQPDATCLTTKPYELRGRIGSKIRLRLINPGNHAMVRFSIDQHVLQVIEVDDTPIEPLYLNELALEPGQRASVVVNLNRGGQFSSFWIRGRMAARCIFGGRLITGLAVLRYTDFLGDAWSIGSPNSAPWPDLAGEEDLCQDIDELYNVKPKIVETPPQTAFSVQQMGTSAGRFVNPGTREEFFGFGMNGINFVNMINDPALARVENGVPINGSNVATLVYEHDGVGGADLIINQLDVGLSHPFHIHGRPFHILARGTGVMTPEKLKDVPLNLVNPLYRDTLSIGSASWALVRIPSDNPGVWPIHCHIGSHLSSGKLGLIVIRPDVVRTFDRPEEWQGLCTGPVDAIGPGRRDTSPAIKGYVPPQGRRGAEKDDLANGKRQVVATVAPAAPASFSMNRSVFTLVQGGQTITGSADIPVTTTPPLDPADLAQYATITGSGAVTRTSASPTVFPTVSGGASTLRPPATSANVPLPSGYVPVAPGIRPDGTPEPGSLEAAFFDAGDVPPTVLVGDGETPGDSAGGVGGNPGGASISSQTTAFPASSVAPAASASASVGAASQASAQTLPAEFPPVTSSTAPPASSSQPPSEAAAEGGDSGAPDSGFAP